MGKEVNLVTGVERKVEGWEADGTISKAADEGEHFRKRNRGMKIIRLQWELFPTKKLTNNIYE